LCVCLWPSAVGSRPRRSNQIDTKTRCWIREKTKMMSASSVLICVPSSFKKEEESKQAKRMSLSNLSEFFVEKWDKKGCITTVFLVGVVNNKRRKIHYRQ
jgi:hypothetical protein